MLLDHRPPFKPAMDETMAVMMQNMPAGSLLTDIDRAFAGVMLPAGGVDR